MSDRQNAINAALSDARAQGIKTGFRVFGESGDPKKRVGIEAETWANFFVQAYPRTVTKTVFVEEFTKGARIGWRQARDG